MRYMAPVMMDDSLMLRSPWAWLQRILYLITILFVIFSFRSSEAHLYGIERLKSFGHQPHLFYYLVFGRCFVDSFLLQYYNEHVFSINVLEGFSRSIAKGSTYVLPDNPNNNDQRAPICFAYVKKSGMVAVKNTGYFMGS